MTDQAAVPGVSPTGIPLPTDLRPGPVIVGVDDVPACGRPLRAAVFLARSLGRSLVVLHVEKRVLPMVEGYVPMQDETLLNGESEAAIDADLRAALIDCGDVDGVDWELQTVTGEPSVELLRIAEEIDAACVVVGKKHKGFADFLHRMASGSVSRSVVAAQKFPVLVVP
ncbi:universal stress protein [Nakamurella silvestris]|nr:universal stress protein [Nakamurella silvestris]